jgi:hypothetical protein
LDLGSAGNRGVNSLKLGIFFIRLALSAVELFAGLLEQQVDGLLRLTAIDGEMSIREPLR